MKFANGLIQQRKRLYLNAVIFFIPLVAICGTFASCVSMRDRTLTDYEAAETEFLGRVTTEFTSYQLIHIHLKNSIKRKAYQRLLEEAKNRYGLNTDVKNIAIKGSFSRYEWISIIGSLALSVVATPFLGPLLSGNFQKITATGDVIALNSASTASAPTSTEPSTAPRVATETAPPRRTAPITQGMEAVAIQAAVNIIERLPEGSNIAVIGIATNNRDEGTFIMDELEFRLVDDGRFTVVDRMTLDAIRSEQAFQMSGEVSDASAVSIGEMLGATIVITGSVTGSGSSRRLNVKALDVKTARIIAMVREAF